MYVAKCESNIINMYKDECILLNLTYVAKYIPDLLNIYVAKCISNIFKIYVAKFI